jgi:preprotein translocase SecF subunit
MALNSTIQIDTIFIISILTVMWYSINDTIVIFDRIRENYGKLWWKEYKSLLEVFEKSLWQTMRRSILTSLSTLFVIISMFIFGTWALQTFAFTLWIGIVAGTYSSIFIAAPLAYLFSGKQKTE